MLALDDVNVFDRRCDTTYFVINDYAKVLASITKRNKFIRSNLFFSEDGYAFKVIVSEILILFCGCKRFLFCKNYDRAAG